MANIKKALDIALIRANKTRVDLVLELKVSDGLIRYVARGERNSPKVRKHLEDFCKEHAPEDYERALKENISVANTDKGEARSQGERPGAENGRPQKQAV